MFLEMIETIKDVDIFYIGPDLTALLPYLTKEQLKTLRGVIEGKGDEHDQAEFIAELIPYLSKTEQATAIKKAFSLIEKTKREAKAEVLSKLIPFSSGIKQKKFVQQVVKKLLNENSLLNFDDILPRMGQYLNKKQSRLFLNTSGRGNMLIIKKHLQ